MMRKIIFCVLLLTVSECAFADIEEFRNFSLNVPEGWTAEESGDVVSVTADDKTGGITIVSGSPEGASTAELAVKFSRSFNGTKPVSDDEDSYSFEFNNGVIQAVVTSDEDFYIMIIGTGVVNNAETLGEIIDSLEMK